MPPLRERRDDIALLVAHFYDAARAATPSAPPAELLADWLKRDWPGNVRELRSAVERAVLFDDPAIWAEIIADDLVPDGSEPPAPAPTFDDTASFRAAKERAVGRVGARPTCAS